MAPAGTPAAVVNRLNTALVSVLDSTEVKARLSTAALEPAFSTPAELRLKIQKDSAKWGRLIREFNIAAD
jgi:tripartite-type tricarboxylate transporter receptor subunit TctC